MRAPSLAALASTCCAAEKSNAKAAEGLGLLPVHNPYCDVGRNDPYPCDSGKKFKNCCLRT